MKVYKKGLTKVYIDVVENKPLFYYESSKKTILTDGRETDEKFVYLVDGKRLKTNKPKRKSRKHIQRASKTPFQMERLSGQEKDNAEIRKFLKERSDYVKTRCH